MTFRSILVRTLTSFAVAGAPLLIFSAQPAAAATTPTSAQRAFISSTVSAAKAASKSSGVPASVLIAASIKASNWGTSTEAKQAKNYFDAPCAASLTASTFAKTAEAQVGKPYVLGAETSPTQTNPPKFDCSELVEWLYARAGTKITDLAASQYAVTKPVSGSPKVGDLVFLKNNPARWNGIGHVAIITEKMSNGDWRIIEARGRAWGVVRSTLSYWKSRSGYTGVRRYSPLLIAGQGGIVLASNTYQNQVGCLSVTTSSGKVVKYRKYSSLASSFSDYAKILSSTPSYLKSVSGTSRIDSYTDAVAAQVNPSSESSYSSSLKQLISDYALTNYDDVNVSMVLTKDMSGDRVTALQYLLKSAGGSLTINGQYDDETAAAVTAFQRRFSLEVDGEAGPEVFSKLMATTVASSNSLRISAVNVLLRMQGYPISALTSYSGTTQNSVKAFQSANALTSSGTVDRATWAKLLMSVQPDGRPTIKGTPAVGSTLDAVAGTWQPGTVTLSYRWYRDGKAISGATAASYTVVAEDAGRALTVRVTGRRSGYTSVTVSSAAATIGTATFTASPAPAISGTTRVGSTLKATTGTWSPVPASLSMQWKRDGKAIASATGMTYTLQPADLGAVITVTTSATQQGHTTTARTSAATAKIAAGTFTASKPKVSGTVKVGKKLTATAGTWSPSATLSYAWYRGTTAIAGATKSSYTLTSADKGKTITVKVTGRKAGYTTKTVASAATGKVIA